MGVNCCSPNKDHKSSRSSIYQANSVHKVEHVHKGPKLDKPVKDKRNIKLTISQAKAIDLFATKTLDINDRETYSGLRTAISPSEIKEEKMEEVLKLEDSKTVLAKEPPEEEKSTHVTRGLISSNSGHICGIDNKSGLCNLREN
eukprot:TRINITY_DN1259_c0_g2_i1.p1 TRINITY_DN1259_c0_g2~~TRINITY_DN1259_c0_g2_i1.p1  ORF type:complete len:144 (+),score=33.58 TRINITY_DN1259_c0_g2_i1:182-613(+)